MESRGLPVRRRKAGRVLLISQLRQGLSLRNSQSSWACGQWLCSTSTRPGAAWVAPLVNPTHSNCGISTSKLPPCPLLLRAPSITVLRWARLAGNCCRLALEWRGPCQLSNFMRRWNGTGQTSRAALGHSFAAEDACFRIDPY